MYRVIKATSSAVVASKGGQKVTGKGWSEFIKNVESQTKFKVDSSCKRRPCEIVDLLDGPDLYEGEVTKYHDGTFELMFDNITGPYENDHQF